MTAYVDDSRKAVGPYVMARLFADTDKELQALATAIGLSPQWSYPLPAGAGTFYQVSTGLRVQATRRRHGLEAQEVTAEQASAMLARLRHTGELGKPADAIEWLRARREQQQLTNAANQGET